MTQAVDVQNLPSGTAFPFDGVQVGRFEIIERLDYGSYGTVYRAKDRWSWTAPESKEVVALKILHVANDGVARTFVREVLTLLELVDNRFVVKIVGHGETDSVPWYAMPLHTKGSLAALVGKATWKDGLRIAHCALLGLHGIHLLNGFHRDVKPQNMLVVRGDGDEDWFVVLSDFGLARLPHVMGTDFTATAAGTLKFMAPEVLDSYIHGRIDDCYTASADIYSLGVTLVALLTGTTDIANWRSRTKDTPKAFASIIDSMLARAPADRPRAEDLAARLQAVAEAPPAPAASTTMPPNPAVPVLVGVVGVLLIAAIAVLASGNEEQWSGAVGRNRVPEPEPPRQAPAPQRPGVPRASPPRGPMGARPPGAPQERPPARAPGAPAARLPYRKPRAPGAPGAPASRDVPRKPK